MRGDNAQTNSQPHPDAVFFRSIKRLENTRNLVGLDAGAFVVEAHFNIRWTRHDDDLQRSFFVHRFDAVFRKVHEDLSKLRAIAGNWTRDARVVANNMERAIV